MAQHVHRPAEVVHHRSEELYEMFSYNLYPGPSAKKGVYGMLLDRGEQEQWVTMHCSTVQVVTPYDNRLTISHEGASGGGKSEMLELAHREPDGRWLLGENVVTGERRHLEIPRGFRIFSPPEPGLIWRGKEVYDDAVSFKTGPRNRGPYALPAANIIPCENNGIQN